LLLTESGIKEFHLSGILLIKEGYPIGEKKKMIELFKRKDYKLKLGIW
jgi:hypothetical protein